MRDCLPPASAEMPAEFSGLSDSSNVIDVLVPGSDAFKWGARISIPRIVFEDKISRSWQMRRVQFPLRLALAVTVNKAQGQSIRKCGVLLRKHLFSHGQLYVALSRVADSPADNGSKKRSAESELTPEDDAKRTAV